MVASVSEFPSQRALAARSSPKTVMKHTYHDDKPARKDTIPDNGESIDVYLDEIARIPTLSNEDEVKLACRLDDERKRIRALAFASHEGLRRIEAIVATICRKPSTLDQYVRARGNREARERVLDGLRAVHETLTPLVDALPEPLPDPLAERSRRLARRDARPNGSGNGRVNGNGNGHPENGHAENGHPENGHPENGHTENGHAAGNEPAANGNGNGTAQATNGNGNGHDAAPTASSIEAIANELSAFDFHMPVVRTLIDDVERNAPAGGALRGALDAYAESIRGLTESHLGIVVKVGRRIPANGLPFADIVQEGNTGLLRAADRFTATDGPFDEFARDAIQDAMRRFTREYGRIIRVPAAQLKLLRALGEYQRTFLGAEGREPDEVESAAHLGVTVEEIRVLERLERAPSSLDEPTDDEESASLGEMLEDPSQPTPLASTHETLLRRRLAEALRTLSVRERNVLRLRFGLGRCRPHTLPEVAEVLRVSPSRARKLQSNAFRKLQNSALRAELEALLDDAD